MACCDELAKSPPRRSERIELIHRETIFRVGALEIGEFQQQLVNNFGFNLLVNPRDNFDITRIETNLPLMWRGDTHVSPDKFAPIHGIPECRRKQPDAISALAKNSIGFFECRDSSPLEVARIGRDGIQFRLNFEPVVEPSHHDGAHWSHGRNVLALELPARQTTLDRFRHGNALWKREANSRIDANALVGG